MELSDSDKSSINSKILSNNDLNNEIGFDKNDNNSLVDSHENQLDDIKTACKTKEKLSKKPWFSAFTITYKQRNEDFKRLFKDLPTDERLLVDYACALQKEILAQGRLYISLNYVCFYANILGWETSLVLKLKEIKSILKDKTVMFIPNAITLVINENEKHFFTSFASRDKTFTTLFRMWQISILEQSIDNEEINTLVRSFYGEDLGYNSNDEEYEYYMNKKLIKSNSNNLIERHNLLFETALTKMESFNLFNETTDFMELEKSSSTPNFHVGFSHIDSSSTTSNSYKISPLPFNYDSNSVELKKKIIENNDAVSNYGQILSQQKIIQAKQNIDTFSSSESANSSFEIESHEDKRIMNKKNTVSSDNEISDSKILEVECNCSEHIGKEILNKNYNLSVNGLFECVFGHTEFCVKFWESRKFFDMKIGEWQKNENIKTRRLEYFVTLNSPVAVKQCKNIEDQKFIKFLSNKCIVIESSSASHGVPYADCFSVICRYCITKVDKIQSNFKVHSYIKYSQSKQPNFVIKAFIEKNAMNALIDSYKYLAENIVEQFIHNELKCHNITRSLSTNSIISNEIKKITSKRLNPDKIHNIEKKINKLSETDDSKCEISTINIYDTSTKKLNLLGENNNKISKKKKVKLNHNNANSLNMKSRNDFQKNSNIWQSKTQNLTTHLIPIQTFSFFKWKINVDTLVRLFIIAMVFLMIINGMLYLKLRRIELLADSLKNDPKIISKYQKILSDDINESENQILINDNLDNQENNHWNEIIRNTIMIIKKMGYSLNAQNQNFNKNDLNINNNYKKEDEF